jgi:hypothetical protein
VRSTIGEKPKKAKSKSELRTEAVKDLHDVLGNPSYTTMMNMISHGSIINTSVTAKDVINNMDVVKNHTARLLATSTDNPCKHSDSETVGGIGEKVNADIIFDSSGKPYLFLEDRFHKLRSIFFLGNKHGNTIVEAIKELQGFYKVHGHIFKLIQTDNETVFRSINPSLNDECR